MAAPLVPPDRPMLPNTTMAGGLLESPITRRVNAIVRATGLVDWFFSGHSGRVVLQWPQWRVGMTRRMAQNGAPTHEIERQGRWKEGGGMVGRYTRGETAGSALLLYL